MATGLNHLFGARGITFTGKLHENFVVFAAVQLNGGFGKAQGVDAALDSFERLGHGVFLNLRDGALAQRQGVSDLIARRRAHVPEIAVLRADEITEGIELFGIDVAHDDVGVVEAANFVVGNIFSSELRGQAVHGLIGFLRDGFLHLDLQDQVRAALQVEAELDLARKIIFYLRDGSGEDRVAHKNVDARKNDNQDERRFVLQIRSHGQKV